MPPMTKKRILFIHGLEGHPNGTKVIKLREQGFNVQAEDMFMSIMDLKRRNSVIRNLLRLREPWVVLAIIIGFLAVSVMEGWATQSNSLWFALCAILMSRLWVKLRAKDMTAQAMGKSFDACVAIQADAVRSAKPDIVVGSSWGGAVAVKLLTDGIWHGPTILLAPAAGSVSRRTMRNDFEATLQKLNEKCQDIPVVIFHDPTDDVVPFTDSELMATETKIELKSVDAGGHRLLGLLDDGRLADEIRRLTA